MPLIKIIDTEVKDKAPKVYDLIPEGAYEVFVDRVSADSDDKASIMFRIRDDVDGDFKKRTIFTNITTAENMGWKLSNIARAAGIPAGTDFDNLVDYGNAITGKSMKIMIAHREYNGKTYGDVKAFYPTRLPDYKTPIDNVDDDLI